MGGKEHIDKVWPFRNKEADTEKFEEPTIDWWQKMKAKQAIIDKQIKAEQWQK